jgi:cyanophycinase
MAIGQIFKGRMIAIGGKEDKIDKSFANIFDDVNLIFIAGGDQLRLTSILGGSIILEGIHKSLKNGVLIAGTSAGAAVLSDTMIYEGHSQDGLIKGKVLTTSGFGFVENIAFDTHFMARGRIGRLVQIVTTNPTCIGIGIGEDSAVLLKKNGTAEVIGSGQVIIVDGSEINHSNIMDIQSGESIAVEHVVVHSLVHGYKYDFKKRSFISPRLKTEDKE